MTLERVVAAVGIIESKDALAAILAGRCHGLLFHPR